MSNSNSSFHVVDSLVEASLSRTAISSDGETLEQRCARLEKERDTLLKRVEVMKL